MLDGERLMMHERERKGTTVGALRGWPMCWLGLVALLGCRRVPATLRPTVDKHLPQVQALAAAAGARCEEVRNTGIGAVIQGTVPTSPATGTALERDPEVLQVEVTCFWPSASGAGTGEGNSFQPLRAQAERRSGSVDVYKLAGDDQNHTLEEVEHPAVRVHDPAAFDLRVLRPTPSGGWIEVVVTLKPGNTVLRPPAAAQTAARPPRT